MKLAEALQIRADLQKRIGQIRERLKNNARVQEGDNPAEEPSVLLAELDRLCSEYEKIIARVNLTNCATFHEGVSLTAMIAKKDVLTLRLDALREFLSEASTKTQRFSNREIKILSTVNVAEMQSDIDERSKELRELNTEIQSLNWTTELI